MSKSSIHISNSSASALLHNERVFDVDYAIDDKARNDVYQYHQIQDLVLEAKADYSFHQKGLFFVTSSDNCCKYFLRKFNFFIN